MRKPAALLAFALVLVPAWSSRADSTRLDHSGALGLSLDMGIEHASVLFLKDAPFLDANRLTIDLEPTFGIGTEGNELVALIRYLHAGSQCTASDPTTLQPLSPCPASSTITDNGGALGFAYRGYFGRDEVKTYFQGGFKADSTPHFAVGPWTQFGFMYELSALVGVYGQLELSMEVGHGLRVGAGASLGIQGRSYVLQ